MNVDSIIDGKELFLIAGPCVVESEEICFTVAEKLKELSEKKASLISEIDGMKGDALLRSQRKEDLQKTLSDKEEELNLLSGANAESKDSIVFFEERAGRYEELNQRAADAEKKLAESGDLIDEAISDVKRLFNDNNDLRQRL